MPACVARWSTTSGLLLFLGSSLLAQGSAVQVTYPRTLRNAVGTVEKIERFTEGQGQFDWLKIPEALRSARAETDAHLRDHPDDVGALMLLARVGRIEAMFAPRTLQSDAGGWVGDTTDHLAPVHAALDRALALEPRLAEAHYWKARIMATSNPRFDGDSMVIDVDWGGCLSNAERAVHLDPSNRRFRELLALALAQHGDFTGAMDAVRDVDRGRNLVYLLLDDFAAVPFPEDGVALPRIAATFAEMYGQSGLGGYSSLRVRAFAVPGSADRLERFYRETWPSFTLFQQQDDEDSRIFGQLLSPARHGFTPETSDRFLTSDRDPKDGIMMLVMEIDGVPEQAHAAYPSDPRLQDLFTQVVLINYRGR